jgi:hypothetical protein
VKEYKSICAGCLSFRWEGGMERTGMYAFSQQEVMIAESSSRAARDMEHWH